MGLWNDVVNFFNPPTMNDKNIALAQAKNTADLTTKVAQQNDLISKQTDLFNTQLTQAAASSAAALKAQQDANLIAAAASQPQSDSEEARAAADEQRRKLMLGSNFGIGLPTQLGAPPVGFRMLSGQ